MSFTDTVIDAYRARLAALQAGADTNPWVKGIACSFGEYTPLYEARVPMLDQGFLRSDLTYDVPAIWDGRYFRLDDHLDRFFASCAKLKLLSPMPRDEMRSRLIEMAKVSGIRDAYVVMITTRGFNNVRATSPEDCANHTYLMLMPYVWIMDPDTQATGGKAVVTRSVRRTPPGAMDPTVKNLQWGDLTRGLLEARERGVMYPILTDGDANVTEGAGYNVVMLKGKTLMTARRGVLEGVTRKTVMEIARNLQLDVQLSETPVEALYEADELFFCSTAGGIMPITELDGAPVADGQVGPLTQQIWAEYWRLHHDDTLSFEVS
ncbi:aminotransferase class IV [Falsirhodobacter sp. 1013]|uniref:aminotransferase class IV n=1 Tax=Falsirhodobacter sp. 1013 TaxID=3417566 RepID=UPI003EB95E02